MELLRRRTSASPTRRSLERVEAGGKPGLSISVSDLKELLFSLRVPSRNPSSPAEVATLAEESHLVAEETPITPQAERISESSSPQGRPVVPPVEASPVGTIKGRPGSLARSSSDGSSPKSRVTVGSIGSQTGRVNLLVYELQKDAFAAPGLKMDAQHIQLWRSEIKPRLEDTLRHQFRPVKGFDPSLALEFMMAGPCETNFKPTVVIICCNEPHRKQLRKIFKAQRWISDYKYHCMVIVDSLEKYSDGIRRPGPKSVRARLSDDFPTLCGVLAEFEDSDHLELTSFTLGGIVLIQDRPFGLTVGHILNSNPQGDYSDSENANNGVEDDSPNEEEHSVESPFIFIEGSDEVREIDNDDALSDEVPLNTETQLHSCSELDDPYGINWQPSTSKVSNWSSIGSLYGLETPSPSQLLYLGSDQDTPRKSDWALIEIPNQKYWHANTYLPPGENAAALVDSILQESNITQRQVWVNAGASGIMSGFLSEVDVHLRLGDSVFNAKQIILDRGLG